MSSRSPIGSQRARLVLATLAAVAAFLALTRPGVASDPGQEQLQRASQVQRALASLPDTVATVNGVAISKERYGGRLASDEGCLVDARCTGGPAWKRLGVENVALTQVIDEELLYQYGITPA